MVNTVPRRRRIFQRLGPGEVVVGDVADPYVVPAHVKGRKQGFHRRGRKRSLGDP